MDADLAALRASCTRALVAHGPVHPADLLATISPEIEVDRYGSGGVVEELESQVAQLLGTAAAVYLPSGTMWTWADCSPTGDPRVQRVELSVGDATMSLSPDDVRDAVARLVGAA